MLLIVCYSVVDHVQTLFLVHCTCPTSAHVTQTLSENCKAIHHCFSRTFSLHRHLATLHTLWLMPNRRFFPWLKIIALSVWICFFKSVHRFVSVVNQGNAATSVALTVWEGLPCGWYMFFSRRLLTLLGSLVLLFTDNTIHELTLSLCGVPVILQESSFLTLMYTSPCWDERKSCL
jgi:hypothetical protein